MSLRADVLGGNAAGKKRNKKLRDEHGDGLVFKEYAAIPVLSVTEEERSLMKASWAMLLKVKHPKNPSMSGIEALIEYAPWLTRFCLSPSPFPLQGLLP